MKIYLADLVHSIPGNYVVPLNIAYLKAYSESIFKNELDITLFKSPNELLSAIKTEPPNILGFSNYSWNYDLNYQIGNYVKTNYPSTTIIMGGCGIRTDREGIKAFLQRNNQVDVYMMFEGEEPFVNFLNAIIETGGCHSWRSSTEEIKGCAYLQDMQLIYSPCESSTDLEKIPSAYLGGHLEKFLKQGLIPLLETNRGCPFRCTYCAWGMSARKKVRKFPTERVCDEIDYIVKANPTLPLWIIADANFGLFSRDEVIAEKIGKIRDANSSLQKVMVETSHNRSGTNLKILNHLGKLWWYLIGVQSFDPIVLKNVKRANIKEDEMRDVIGKVKAMGMMISTDIILGLPGETKQSHLNTLRKSIELGFDYFGIYNVRMLPGSELEADEQRQKYSIKTKYRLIQGSYGTYQGIKSLEAEESIRSTSAMPEDDMLYFRLVHWLIWVGWNTRFLSPLRQFLEAKGVNILDLIIGIVDGDKTPFPLVDRLFSVFKKDAEQEWFETYDSLREYYLSDQNFERLLDGGFSKLNFKYMAELMLNQPTFLSLIDFIKTITERCFAQIPSDIFRVMKESLIDVNEINQSSKISDKVIDVHTDILPFIVLKGKIASSQGEITKLFLSKDDDHIEALRKLYDKFGFNTDRHLAVEKILEYFPDGFTYDISVERER